MVWTPLLVQTLMTIAVLVGIGLAVFGQVRWRATQEFEALAEVRAQRIAALEKEIDILRGEAKERAESLATVQRLNFDLQRRLATHEQGRGPRDE